MAKTTVVTIRAHRLYYAAQVLSEFQGPRSTSLAYRIGIVQEAFMKRQKAFVDNMKDMVDEEGQRLESVSEEAFLERLNEEIEVEITPLTMAELEGLKVEQNEGLMWLIDLGVVVL